MPVSDQKKVATMIKRMAESAEKVRAAVDEMTAVKNAFQAHNPDVTGTPLEGNVSAVNSAYTALKTEADKAIWTTLINAAEITHRGEAI